MKTVVIRPRSLRVFFAIGLVVLGAAVCSRQDAHPAPGGSTDAAPRAEAPPKDANLVAADMGGAVEEVTAYFGPGWRPYFRFTPTGQPAEEPVTQDGPQLSRAVMLSALHRLPYDILDASGRVIVSGQTSELGRELRPGSYRIRIEALGQTLEEPLTIVANQTTKLALGVDGDRFVIRR